MLIPKATFCKRFALAKLDSQAACWYASRLTEQLHVLLKEAEVQYGITLVKEEQPFLSHGLNG